MMRRNLSWVGIFLGSLVVSACESDVSDGGGSTETGGTDGTGGSGAMSSTGGAGPGSGLPCDVQAVLASKCQTCHGSEPSFGAPMSLVTREDLLATPPTWDASTVGQALVERVTEGSMPPPPNAELSPESQAILSAYVQAGMPEGNCSEGGGGAGGGGEGGGYALPCEPNVDLLRAGPFEMPADVEDVYMCFGVEAPSDIARHITAIVPNVDNDTIVHHILLMQSDNPVSPTGQECSAIESDWKLIYAWGPGTPPMILPPEAGFPIGPDEPKNFIIQVHYSNLMALAGELDETTVSLCTTDELRPNDADVMAFGGLGFTLAPQARTDLDCETAIPAFAATEFPVTIFQSWPHMHKLGAEFTSKLIKATGEELDLAIVGNYDFEYQVTYPVDQFTLGVGDSVRTVCTYDNPSPNEVKFGEDTSDEMCFNFLAYYPRIEADQWQWILPAAYADCTSEPGTLGE